MPAVSRGFAPRNVQRDGQSGVLSDLPTRTDAAGRRVPPVQKGDANGDGVGIRAGAERGWLDQEHTECQRPHAIGDGHRFALSQSQEESTVLYYALMFLVVALIAGVLGVTGVAGVASQIAWVLFVIGIILLIVNFLTGSRPRSVV